MSLGCHLNLRAQVEAARGIRRSVSIGSFSTLCGSPGFSGSVDLQRIVNRFASHPLARGLRADIKIVPPIASEIIEGFKTMGPRSTSDASALREDCDIRPWRLR